MSDFFRNTLEIKAMARHPEFAYRNTPRGWEVNNPASLSASGKRERHFFRTRDEAKEHAARLREKAQAHGKNAIAIKPSLAEDATKAAEELKPWGASLLEAARFFAAARERETASKPLGEAADLWISSCEGLRPKTIRNYKMTVTRLRNGLGDKLLANVTPEELQAAVAPLGTAGAAAAERVRNTKAFWFWSAKKGWCDAKTFAKVEMPKSNKDAEIQILSVADAEALLRTAEQHFPQSVASFALQLFGGIRVEETTRLEAENVTADGIELSAAVSKRGRRRHITPSETLAAWLERWPFENCSNWQETSAAVRRLAGWDVVSVILNDRVTAGTIGELPEPHRGRWPQNALRHSHASYSVAAGVELKNLLFEFGHVGGENLLRTHYVGMASKRDALKYFAIVPTPAAGEQATKIPTLKIA